MAFAADIRKRYDGIDYMKFICALLVVAIHAVPFTEFGHLGAFEVAQVVSRIAVPFFFICSGFFFARKLMAGNGSGAGALRALMKRLLWLYAGWCAIYFAYDFRLCLKIAGSWAGAIGLYLRNLLFLGGHFHLWYLPALMLAMALLYLAVRWDRISQFFWVAVLLYIIGLAGNSYYGLTEDAFWLKQLYEGYFSIFVTTRNGLFFGFLYVMLGGVAASRKISLSYTSGMLLAAVFMLLLHGEAYLLEWYHIPREYDMYIMAAPFTYYLFQALLSAGRQLKDRSAEFFRSTSMGIYFIHGIFLIVYEKLLAWSGLLLIGTLYFLLVAVSSVVAVWLLNKVRNPVLQSLLR